MPPRGWLLRWPSRRTPTTPARFCDSSFPAVAERLQTRRGSTAELAQSHLLGSQTRQTARWTRHRVPEEQHGTRNDVPSRCLHAVRLGRPA
jgi:hypothetical protein